MPIVHVVVILVVIGLLLWAVEKLVPMNATIKRIIYVVILVAVVLWLLGLFVPGLGIQGLTI